MSELAWHWVADTLRDGSPIPPDGEWLEYDGECVMCQSGLHASYNILDALFYAPGFTTCRVEVDGIADEQSDKLVASRRRILWRADVKETVLAFARNEAKRVLYLWDAPEIVVRFLEIGNAAYATRAADVAAYAAKAANVAKAANAAYAARSTAYAARAIDAARPTAYATEYAAYATRSAAYAADVAAYAAKAANVAKAAAYRQEQTKQLEVAVMEARDDHD